METHQENDPLLIKIKGAKANNLKGFKLDLPLYQLIAVTGVSGSGKSSLITNILQREGSRRYLETFSNHTRQFIQKISQGEAEKVTGIPPVIFLDQHRPSKNPRSTISTLSGMESLLRLLFSRSGIPHCNQCGKRLQSVSDLDLATTVAKKFAGTNCKVLAPLVEDKKGNCRAALDFFKKSQWQSILIDGNQFNKKSIPLLSSKERHQIFVITKTESQSTNSELKDGIYNALQLTNGRVRILIGNQHKDFTTKNCCLTCAQSIPKIGPRLFSFNADRGACPECKGLGVVDFLDPALIVKDSSLSLRQGALHLSTPNGYIMYSQVTLDVLDTVCQAHGFSVDIPWNQLNDQHKAVIYHGSQKIKVPFGKHPLENRLKWKGITAKPREEGFYPGITTIMNGILKKDRNPGIMRFVSSITCPSCQGNRLCKEALAVFVNNCNFSDVQKMELNQLRSFLSDTKKLKTTQPSLAPLYDELLTQLEIFDSLGVGYLSGNRLSSSLSTGEYQRLRLANRLTSDLSGLLYLLDEPSTGLHLQDRERLTKILRNLRDKGNTVITIEHDPDAMLRADWITEIGPGAGKNGGNLLFNGSIHDFLQNPNSFSPTRQALTKQFRNYAIPLQTKDEWFEIKNVCLNNLQNLTVRFHNNALNMICGPSGAGKSSLLEELENFASKETIFDSVITLDQSPIGRTPRSNPATYTGIADLIRDRFAALAASKDKGFNKSRFSFNVRGGRCEQCQGSGTETTTLHFLEKISIPCSWCNGQRFNEQTLEIKFAEHTIADIYQLTINQALEVFAGDKKIVPALQTLHDLGLGYLTLGQPSPTLSGGEAQRIRLASELNKAHGNKRLYLLDEPSCGLHPQDLSQLIYTFNKLLIEGHTLVLIEHHPTLLCQSQHIIELGPGSGINGGQLLFCGNHHQLLKQNTSTAIQLQKHLQKNIKAESVANKKNEQKKSISIINATTNNLKSVSVTIPKNKLTVVTGVSGSGKSSLISDTLVQKAHNEFLKGIPLYARRMLQVETPTINAEFKGLTPVVHLAQQTPDTSGISTVGTITEIWNDLRLLFSRFGKSKEFSHPLSMSHFSFFHPLGVCNLCHGKGSVLQADEEKILTDQATSIYENAMGGTKGGQFFTDANDRYFAVLRAVETKLALQFNKPFNQLSSEEKSIILRGCGSRIFSLDWHYKRGNRTGIHKLQEEWKGFLTLIEEEYEKRKNSSRGEIFHQLMKEIPCISCHGDRLNSDSLSVEVDNSSIADCGKMELSQLNFWLNKLKLNYDLEEPITKSGIIAKIQRSLHALIQLGLAHLTLLRTTNTLSTGELQRVRLSGLLNSQLSGLTIVLDEPSSSLHSNNIQNLLQILDRLKNNGNTIIVVEHNEQFIEAADQIIDMGPGAGTKGGTVIYNGTKENFATCNSVTAQFLRNTRSLKSTTSIPQQQLIFTEIGGNNLQPQTVLIPLQKTTAICGVSGSGKSSLLSGVINRSLLSNNPINCRSIEGIDAIKQHFYLDRKSAHRPPQMMVGEIFGAFTDVQKKFASSPSAIASVLTISDFSLTGGEGRCQLCQGTGYQETNLDYLGSSRQNCPECHGNRYREIILQCQLKGKNINDFFAMSVEEISEHFPGEKIAKCLEKVITMGLGYLLFGQPFSSLSGGEKQRVALAEILAQPDITDSLILLDEPGAGLHGSDLTILKNCFDQLIARKNTIVLVEHRFPLLAQMDHLIELGPDGGKGGGQILFCGSPMQLATNPTATGKALKKWSNTRL